ncbi:MAG: proton-conducting transporter membrane subunit, partial [Gammaproteobacteria bacterium]
MLIEAAILIPAVGAVLIGLSGRHPNLREAITLISSVSLFVVVAKLYSALNAGTLIQVEILEVVPGLSLAFAVEPLGMLFALVASFLWIVTSIYSIGYMRGHHEQNQTRFYVCFALALSSVMGLTFSANMFTLFIFYELITLITYPLVTHSGTDEAKRSGRLYLGYLLGTSIGLQLLAIIWTWTITGTLDFTEGGILTGKTTDVVITVLFALYVFGIGKAALMPFHRWLPAAMVAPTPVSALLHAVAVVKAGVFTVLKVTLYIFGIDLLATTGASEWLIYMATATILIASIIAMSKDNLKARLAYSTVSQLAYIVLGAMLASSLGIIGSGMHIAMHAFGKITLFFCAGAILVATHKSDISQMRGLGRTMPLTMMAFLIGSLSIIGLPPMGGLWSKWFLVMGTLETQYYIP